MMESPAAEASAAGLHRAKPPRSCRSRKERGGSCKVRGAEPRAPPSATGRPSPPTAFCSFLATAVDPSPKLRGRGVSGCFCFPDFLRGKDVDRWMISEAHPSLEKTRESKS